MHNRGPEKAEAWPERIDPEAVPAGILAHHLKKYDLASTLAESPVLDIACGLGYGTAHLASAGILAYGIELDQAAVKVATTHYASPTCHYIRGDATALPFGDDRFATIVCFEGIEHFVDPDRHVAEAARVLRRNGVYLVSTPRAGTGAGTADNPYHLHEFGPESLTDLLRIHFGEVTVLGQRRVQTDAHRVAQRADVFGLRRLRPARPLARAVSRILFRTSPTEDASLTDFAIDAEVTRADELIGVCRKPAHA